MSETWQWGRNGPADLPGGGPGGENLHRDGIRDPRVVQGDQHDLLIV
jgi:hypothetical protein